MTPPKITPVLISGGAGTRLWPISRRERPKQFHAFGAAESLIQDTARRMTGELFDAPLVLASAGHLDLVVHQLGAIGVTPKAVITEPVGRNTGPAAAAAAAYVAKDDPDALILLIHADNRVANIAELHRALALGVPAALDGKLVIFGLQPTTPHTGYGYIRAGDGEGPVYKVAGFQEKPDLATAKAYLADGRYTWNSGMFLFRAGAFMDEMAALAPEIASVATQAVTQGVSSGLGFQLGEVFREAPSEPIDTAVFEKTDKAMVVSLADIGWADVGSWEAIWEGMPQDADGNALNGDAIGVGARDCLAITDGPTVVLSDVEGLVVVVDRGVVLVTRRDSAQAMRAAVDAVRLAKPSLL